ncbi:hypothetical protein BVX98_01115 [bacterium F11]|nr:hypothetical protein BVX98_01115 [bacterium F11]
MSLNKKVFLFLAIFLVIGCIALVVLIKGRPAPMNVNPLSSLKEDQIGKIVIKTPSLTLTLQQDEDEWKIMEPIQDEIDMNVLDQILKAFQEFSVESVISENKEKYPQFELIEGEARRLQVFEKGSDVPLLDGFFGKRANLGYGSSYFRFTDQDPVHLVTGFPLYHLQRTSNDFRQKQILSQEVDQLLKMKFEIQNGSLELVPSSSTWANAQTGEKVTEDWVKNLKAKIRSLRAMGFDDEKEKSKDRGFDKPILIVTLEGPDKKTTLKIGNLIEPVDDEKPEKRYAQKEGRDAILLLQDNTVVGFLAHLSQVMK